MKLDKICRTCLVEKTCLKSIFSACLPNMLMTCSSIQVIDGDGLPNKICTQCLQMLNRSFAFKEQCEKSDSILREYLNKINLAIIDISDEQNLIRNVKNDQLFENNDVLQQSVLFNEIFGSETSQSLVDNFASQTSTVVSDLADTMQSLQTLAEQCLPESWENETNIINTQNSSEDTTCHSLSAQTLLKCQFCEESFRDEWNLAEHIKIHTGSTSKYYCTICAKVFSSLSILSKHMGEHNYFSQRRIDTNKFQNCNLCGKQFVDVLLLKQHLKNDHSEVKSLEKKHICTICGKRYYQNKLLVIHLRSHTGERPLSCEICGKNFSLPSSLHKHKLVHNPVRRFNCTICGKAFKQMSHVRAHMHCHSGQKPFTCKICGKAYTTNINLEIHMRLHTGEKPYQCSNCDSSFPTSSQLKKHFMKHTGEKPYKCNQCEKSFRQKDTRDTHVRYHTGERPYACRLCPKRYIAASHLREHMKGHTGDRKYQCNICSKAFVQARTLRSHLTTHTRKTSHTCTFCGQNYSQIGTLSNHIKVCQGKSTK